MEAGEKLISKLGPIGARRYWLYSLIASAENFMDGDGKNVRGYANDFRMTHVPVEELLMTHPIHEEAISKTTARAALVSKMARKRIGRATCPKGVDLTLSERDVNAAMRSGGHMWGFRSAMGSMGGSNKVLVTDGNGRTAALKWALQGRCLTEACVRATVPVEVMTFADTPSLGLSLLQELATKLYMCTDQGSHTRKLEAFFAGEHADTSQSQNRSSPSSCAGDSGWPVEWLQKQLSEFAKELDNSDKAEAWSEDYRAQHILDNDELCTPERWKAFLTRLTTTYEPFYKNYQKLVKTGRTSYNIDCVGRDKEVCAIPGTGIKKSKVARR
jgi:hypothetical protein